MKTFLYLFLLILLFNTATFAIGDEGECKKCGQRIIICWDLNINTPKPVLGSDSILWKQLHYASEGYIKSMMGKESPECLSFLPSCRIGDDSPPWLKPCPYNGQSPTDTYNADYELFGDISGKEGAYVLRLTLVTVKRERVASVTKKFEKAAESAWHGSLAALDLGGSDAGSRKLYDVIHDFEVKKRDAAQGIKYNRVAFNASVKFKSEKYKVKINEGLPVEIELKDCDDVPLKSALLELQVAKGRFENNKVETDQNGVAHALYIAPGEPGVAQVKVEYKYRRPSEKLGFASDFTEISFAKPVDSLKADIQVEIYKKTTSKEDKKVIKISEETIGFGTSIVMKIFALRVKMLLESPEYRNSEPGRGPVVLGDSWEFVYDYTKGTKPIKNFRTPLNVSIKTKTEGYRSYGNKDWGPLYQLDVADMNDFQHLTVSISPLVKELSSGTTLLPPYVFTFSAPPCTDKYGVKDYDKSVNGSAGKWNGLSQTMEPISPPYQYNVPYESFFSSQSWGENDKVTPLLIDSKRLNEYLLNPEGEFVLNLQGTAFHPNDYEDIEQQVTVKLVLMPLVR